MEGSLEELREEMEVHHYELFDFREMCGFCMLLPTSLCDLSGVFSFLCEFLVIFHRFLAWLGENPW